ncbi:subtilisin-like protease [Musa troglodytarum]|uniref:Subtilisin-like protease n=1 Tax=Musa troglodytarum TaxID=320322 RepID=A0A9E7ELP8_9LILI|nr:subtilisin-like protease [Musa troglodytarum]
MALPKRFLSLLVCLFASLPLSCLHVHGSDELKAFIVHVKRPENLSFSVAEQWAGWYSSLLSLASLEANATDFARSRVIHSYRHVATGFSALLTEREVEAMSKLGWFLHAGSVPFHSDPVALAGFEAINRGVFVSCSAGNSGPDPYTVTNTAPWLLTVGASTMDRSFLGTVKLGDGQEWEGASLYPPRNFDAKMLPLVYAAGDVAASHCLNDSLNGVDVRGKIVLCDRGDNSRLEKAEVVKSAGGAGVILVNTPEDAYSTVADPLVLPASNVPYVVGLKIKAYINSTSAPEASLVFNGTVMHTPHSPSMASFSSRGPSQITPGILKPDITGPGVSILAAWTMQKFNMISGTSMSCPHLSGIAALIRKANPDWSPAAIKSAIMTTAYVTDNSRGPILDERHLPADFFAIGAGHVNPPKAIDPGLVYDLTPQDYIPYLCGLYESYLVEVIVGRPVDCSSPKSIREGELNYPSISLTLPANNLKSVRYRRTVTNVGEPTSTYRVKLDVPQEVSATVTPTRLSFDELNQKQSFSISFRRNGGGSGAVQGQLLWVSTKHVVRSPISIRLE